MNYILFDDKTWTNLLPLTYTRPVSEIRFGILTIKEKWEKYLQTTCSYYTQQYLSKKYPLEIGNTNIFINSSLIPSAELLSEIDNLEIGQVLVHDDTVCALKTDRENAQNFNPETCCIGNTVQTISDCTKISELWDIFTHNADAIEHDFRIITKGRKSAPLSKTNTVIGDNDIFIERNAIVECCVLNTKAGPIYIGKGTEIMENTVIRGPFALCQGSIVKVGAKIYGPTTIGPHSRVGGELNNVVIIGYSNKGHDGFLGNAVIGEWCNLGADTNNSNLKNNYAEVKLWSYHTERFVKTGLQFCGLIMGDHSKCGINTMFNTGTVIGVACNIFGSGYPRNFIPSFAWGGAQGFTECKIDKAYEIAQLVMERRGKEFEDDDKQIFKTIFEKSAKFRKGFS